MRAALRDRRAVVRFQGQQGASAVEYGLVVSLIAAVLVIVLFALGRIAGGSFTSIDCWSSTGGSGCSAEAVPGDAPASADPVVVVAEPPVPSAPAAQLCNQSGNGNGTGQGRGNCG